MEDNGDARNYMPRHSLICFLGLHVFGMAKSRMTHADAPIQRVTEIFGAFSNR